MNIINRYMLHTWDTFFTEADMEQQKIDLKYPEVSKSVVDNRKIGIMVILFDDWELNRTSPYKFGVDVNKFRVLQGKMDLGDYGGVFDPSYILQKIGEIEQEVQMKSLVNKSMDEIFKEVIGIEGGVALIGKLKKISEVASKLGTKIRACNVQVI